MLKIIALSFALLIVLFLTALFIAIVKKEQYNLFQKTMAADKRCLWKFNKKYTEVKIKEVFEYNVLVEDKYGVLHVVGRVDLYPSDF